MQGVWMHERMWSDYAAAEVVVPYAIELIEKTVWLRVTVAPCPPDEWAEWWQRHGSRLDC